MIKLYIAECNRENQHQTGRILARYALLKAFGLDLPLVYGDNGKPGFEAQGVFVSISHSGELCLASVSDSEIGADIQLSDRDERRMISLAQRFFSSDEYDYVIESPGERFYEIWCKKESYIKYTGEGMSRRLSDFSVLRVPLEFWSGRLGKYTLAVCSEQKFTDSPIIVGKHTLLTEQNI